MSESNSEIIISNQSVFDEKLASLKAGGLSNVHIVSDFDRTATKGFSEGRRVESSYAAIRNHEHLLKPISKEKYFSEFSDIELHAVQNGFTPISESQIPYSVVAKRMWEYYYHEYEINHDVKLELRYQKMVEWWSKHFNLMAYCGLTKTHLNLLVDENDKIGRVDFFETLDFCAKKNIPFLFFSAGIQYFIEKFLQNHNAITPNLHIVSNEYEFDEKGTVLGAKGEMIHVFSKGHVDLSHFDYVDVVKEHENVLVLGDSIGDVDMIANIPHKVALKIGFLNDKVAEQLELYKQNYDVVITNDGPFTFIKELLESLESD